MLKEVLSEYTEKKSEIKDLEHRIEKLRAEILKIENQTVSDTVSGGMGGIQHYKIEGVPIPEYDRKRRALQVVKLRLEEKHTELLEQTETAYRCIDRIKNSEIRTMLRLYYIDGMTWYQVAYRMNSLYPSTKRVYTEDSCKKRCERFLKKLKNVPQCPEKMC